MPVSSPASPGPEESGAPALLVVRLKVAGQQITEIETVTTRSRTEGSIFNIAGLDTPSEAMGKVPRPEQLPTREEAIRIARLYPAGLDAGSLADAIVPLCTWGTEHATEMARIFAERDALSS